MHTADQCVGLAGGGVHSLHEQFVVLGAGALGFKAHAAPRPAVLAGIDDMRVPGGQQRALMGAAGAVPDIVPDVVIETPVQESGQPDLRLNILVIC